MDNAHLVSGTVDSELWQYSLSTEDARLLYKAPISGVFEIDVHSQEWGISSSKEDSWQQAYWLIRLLGHHPLPTAPLGIKASRATPARWLQLHGLRI